MDQYDKEGYSQCCIYKLKDGKTLNSKIQCHSKYVYLEAYAKNPITNEFICIFTYVNKYTLEPISEILPYGFLTTKDFEDKFEKYLTCNEIKWIINELEKEEE